MRRAAGAILAAALVVSAAPAWTQPPSAASVIARTKVPNGDYSLFQWTHVVDDDGKLHSIWAAEFHRGALHRVETPYDRIVANCASKTGTHLSLLTGETRTGPDVAETACGIDTLHIASMDYAGQRASVFGPLDVLVLRNKGGLRRTYWVDQQGVLIGSQFNKHAEPADWVLRNWVVKLNRTSPEPAMFITASVNRSFVPAEFRNEPSTGFSLEVEAD